MALVFEARGLQGLGDGGRAVGLRSVRHGWVWCGAGDGLSGSCELGDALGGANGGTGGERGTVELRCSLASTWDCSWCCRERRSVAEQGNGRGTGSEWLQVGRLARKLIDALARWPVELPNVALQASRCTQELIRPLYSPHQALHRLSRRPRRSGRPPGCLERLGGPRSRLSRPASRWAAGSRTAVRMDQVWTPACVPDDLSAQSGDVLDTLFTSLARRTPLTTTRRKANQSRQASGALSWAPDSFQSFS